MKSIAGAAGGVIGAGVLARVGLGAAPAQSLLSAEDIVRAWKDEEFRASLMPEQLAQLPANPAGAVEVQQTESSDTLRGRPETRGPRTRCCCRATF